MSSNLHITIATWDYDRIRPILDGRVKVEGCDVNYLVLPPEECFYRAYELREFEVSEIGFVPYIIAKAQDLNPYVAVPVFLSRMFRHSSLYIRTDRDIYAPADLKGKTIGVIEYQMSAGMWCRGMLQDDYNVRPEDIVWRQGGVNVAGRKEKFPLNLDKDFPLEPIPAGTTLSALLGEGNLDAIISPEPPTCFVDGSAQVARLFKDYEKAERQYYRRHGHFPIMHALGVRNDVLAEHPWLPDKLYKAFSEAKRLSDLDLFELRALKVGIPWITSHALDTIKFMGQDFWSYGVEKNRSTLELMTRYAYEQGLAVRKQSVDELFTA